MYAHHERIHPQHHIKENLRNIMRRHQHEQLTEISSNMLSYTENNKPVRYELEIGTQVRI